MNGVLEPPILFAHRGARAIAPDNTIEGFELARKLGATGLESDAWTTSDGYAVLDHNGVVRHFGRRKSIGDTARADLPGHIPEFADLVAIAGSELHLSIDCKDSAVGYIMIDEAQRHRFPLDHLWLCSSSLETLGLLRENNSAVRLVNSQRLHKIREGPERRVADLQELDVQVLNMHCSDWTVGLTTLVHRFGLYAFAWDAQQPRTLMEALSAGADAVYSDHVDRMIDAMTSFHR